MANEWFVILSIEPVYVSLPTFTDTLIPLQAAYTIVASVPLPAVNTLVSVLPLTLEYVTLFKYATYLPALLA